MLIRNYFYCKGHYFIRTTLLISLSLFLSHCTNQEESSYPDQISSVYRHIEPVSDSNSVHFFLISDWGFNGSTDQRTVAESMVQLSEKIRLDMIFTCGDNFQYEGVESVYDPLWTKNYENVYSADALNVKWYPALGNHDHRGNTNAQVKYSSVSDSWQMPAHYYTFRKFIDSANLVRFIILDTHAMIGSLNDESNYDDMGQYSWLKNILSVSIEKWIIVIGHHPVYSAGAHGDTEELTDLLGPLFEEHNVDFYICGHDHNFEHAKVQYTDYIVTGTGGSIRRAGNNSRTVYSLSRLGFTYIALSADVARLFFITDDAQTAYFYEKTKYRNPSSL